MASSSFRTLSSCSKLASTGTLARRAAQAATSRTYATAASSSSSPQAADYSVTSSSSGIKVASLDEGSPTSAITVAVKAGPRYEPSPGLAHVLKNFVFKVCYSTAPTLIYVSAPRPCCFCAPVSLPPAAASLRLAISLSSFSSLFDEGKRVESELEERAGAVMNKAQKTTT